jgi:hypothetical protein
MATDWYWDGEVAQIEVSFSLNEDGTTPVDPSTVLFAYTLRGTTTTFQYLASGTHHIVKLSVGSYRVTLPTTTFATTMTGNVFVNFAWQTAGTDQGYKPGTFQVRPKPVTPSSPSS